MSLDILPFRQSEVGAVGAAAGAPIVVNGIRTGNVLLAVIKHNAATGVVLGLDPSDFVVSNNAIQSASVSTAGHMVAVLYYS